jgi:extradiol dioxygenase
MGDVRPRSLGLEFVGHGPDGEVRLRNDDAVQRILIHQAETNDLAYFGWGVADSTALGAVVDRLLGESIGVERGDAALARQRGVTEIAWFTDPFGFRHELTYGLLRRPSTFRPGRAMSGFVTGEGGVGHAVVVVPDLAAVDDFYARVLGFKLSDTVEIGVSLRFYHCNSRHHTLALMTPPAFGATNHPRNA